MARTGKSRGSIPFQMRSGNSSPNKFLNLGNIGRGLLGGVGSMAGRLFGGRGGGAQGEVALKQPKAGAIWGGGGPNLPGGAPGMATGPLAKRSGYKKYQQKMCPSPCPSPMKGADAVLVRGAYDAASGKGTTKYGMIAKTRAMGNISRIIGETVASWPRVQAPKRRVSMKKIIKNQMKMNKFRQRKSRGIFDKMRYA